MVHLLIRLYNLFSNRKKLLMIIIALIITFIGVIVSKIHFEENITAFLPRNEQFENINSILGNNPFVDQIIVIVSPEKQKTDISPQQLITVSDEFISELNKNFTADITDIRYDVSQDTILKVYNLFSGNLPVFLEKDDYSIIEERITPRAIDVAFQNNYKLLTSPGSVVMKKFIPRDPLSFTPLVLKKLQKIQIDDNYHLYNNRIFTKDNQNLLFFMHPCNSSNKTSLNANFFNRLDKKIAQLQLKYDNRISIEYFGAPVVAAGNAEQIKKDIIVTISIALFLILSLIIFILRDKKIIYSLLIPSFLGGGIALTILYFIKPHLSLISLGIGSVLVGITVDYAIHIITHLRKHNNVIRSIKDLTLPIVMSSITTASAFLCLIVINSEILIDLGLFSCMSVIFAALLALIILPHIFSKDEAHRKTGSTKVASWFNKIIQYKFEANKLLLFIIFVLSITFLFFNPGIAFEKDLNTFNFVSKRLAKTENKLNAISTFSLKSLMLIIRGETQDKALAANEQLYQELQQLENENKIGKIISVSPLMMSAEKQQKKISLWNNFWTPQKKKLLKNRIMTSAKKYKFKQSSFKAFFELINNKPVPLNEQELHTIKTIFYNDLINSQNNSVHITSFLKVTNENKQYLFNYFENRKDLTIADRQYVITRFIRFLEKKYVTLINFSLLVIFFILFIFLGRLEYAFITSVPIVLSWSITLGLMDVLHIKFNIFNIIIATFIFGLGIDYSIFIMRGLIQKYSYNYDNIASYKSSILFSVCTTIFGLGALLFAEHPVLKSIATLSIIGISSVIIISFTILPFLFKLFIERSNNRTPITLSRIVQSILIHSFFVTGCVLLLPVSIVLFILPVSLRLKRRIFSISLMVLCRIFTYILVLILPIKKNIWNDTREHETTPCVMVANHQSLLDIIVLLSLSSKVVIMTREWVWRSPLFGYIVRLAGFYPSHLGLDNYIKKFKKLAANGYSLIVFPEGHRSKTEEMQRFHKGAFYIAGKMRMDIQPVLLHGTGTGLEAGGFLLQATTIHTTFLDRISFKDKTFGKSYSEKAKQIKKYMQYTYSELKVKYAMRDFQKYELISNHLYKKPLMATKTNIELLKSGSYKKINSFLPAACSITEVGCAYGALSFILSATSPQRQIVALDRNEDSIALAQNCIQPNKQNVKYIACDSYTKNVKKSDFFILHKEQIPETAMFIDLIHKCISLLPPEGNIIIIYSSKKQTAANQKMIYDYLQNNKFKFDVQLLEHKTVILKNSMVNN